MQEQVFPCRTLILSKYPQSPTLVRFSLTFVSVNFSVSPPFLPFGSRRFLRSANWCIPRSANWHIPRAANQCIPPASKSAHPPGRQIGAYPQSANQRIPPVGKSAHPPGPQIGAYPQSANRHIPPAGKQALYIIYAAARRLRPLCPFYYFTFFQVTFQNVELFSKSYLHLPFFRV